MPAEDGFQLIEEGAAFLAFLAVCFFGFVFAPVLP